MLEAFAAAMRNDFNTPAALGVLSKPLSEVNGLLASAKGVAKDLRKRSCARFVRDMETVAGVLGCFGQEPAAYLAARRDLKAGRIAWTWPGSSRCWPSARPPARPGNGPRPTACARPSRRWAWRVKDGPGGSVWTL